MIVLLEAPGQPSLRVELPCVPAVGHAVRLPAGQARTRRYVVETVEWLTVEGEGESSLQVSHVTVSLRPEP